MNWLGKQVALVWLAGMSVIGSGQVMGFLNSQMSEFHLLDRYLQKRHIFAGALFEWGMCVFDVGFKKGSEPGLARAYHREFGIDLFRDHIYHLASYEGSWVDSAFAPAQSVSQLTVRFAKNSALQRAFVNLCRLDNLRVSDSVSQIKYRIRPWLDEKLAKCHVIELVLRTPARPGRRLEFDLQCP